MIGRNAQHQRNDADEAEARPVRPAKRRRQTGSEQPAETDPVAVGGQPVLAKESRNAQASERQRRLYGSGSPPPDPREPRQRLAQVRARSSKMNRAQLHQYIRRHPRRPASQLGRRKRRQCDRAADKLARSVGRPGGTVTGSPFSCHSHGYPIAHAPPRSSMGARSVNQQDTAGRRVKWHQRERRRASAAMQESSDTASD